MGVGIVYLHWEVLCLFSWNLPLKTGMVRLRGTAFNWDIRILGVA